MPSRTTVAIDKKLRKRLKKVAAILDITQSEVIERALDIYEKTLKEKIISRGNIPKENEKDEVQKILKNATKLIWQQDPERKILQKKLKKGSDTIDDYILNSWVSDLNNES